MSTNNQMTESFIGDPLEIELQKLESLVIDSKKTSENIQYATEMLSGAFINENTSVYNLFGQMHQFGLIAGSFSSDIQFEIGFRGTRGLFQSSEFEPIYIEYNGLNIEIEKKGREKLYWKTARGHLPKKDCFAFDIPLNVKLGNNERRIILRLNLCFDLIKDSSGNSIKIIESTAPRYYDSNYFLIDPFLEVPIKDQVRTKVREQLNKTTKEKIRSLLINIPNFSLDNAQLNNFHGLVIGENLLISARHFPKRRKRETLEIVPLKAWHRRLRISKRFFRPRFKDLARRYSSELKDLDFHSQKISAKFQRYQRVKECGADIDIWVDFKYTIRMDTVDVTKLIFDADMVRADWRTDIDPCIPVICQTIKSQVNSRINQEVERQKKIKTDFMDFYSISSSVVGGINQFGITISMKV